MQQRDDESWIKQALELARRGLGLTRPNPAVGAVVVKNGRCVGSGWHRKAGGPHAEIVALRAAGKKAAGGVLYVTLEPCSTWGRTPPCTDAIAAAGIARVVIGCRDPNPKHAGRGVRILRKAGVAVAEGLCRGEAQELIAPFAKWIVRRRPFVTLKLAMSLDGRIADARRSSRWITGPQARQMVHLHRSQADAIMVGIGTALADDPSLLPSPARGRKPFRVIVDSAGRLPLGAKCLRDGAVDQTIVATTAKSPAAWREAITCLGATVLVAGNAGKHVDVAKLMGLLGRLGLVHVYVEGGGELASAMVARGLVDEYEFYYGPRLLGGASIPSLGGRGWLLDKAPALRIAEVRMLGDDIMVRAMEK